MPKPFPYFLTRVGGEPITLLEKLAAPEINELSKKIFEVQERKNNLGKKLSDHLYDLIPNVENEEEQKTLLGLKRDVFNGRTLLDPKPYQDLVKAPELGAYFQACNEFQELKESYEASFDKHMVLAREGLKEAAASEPLKLGISLSSNILLSNLPKFVERPADSFRKKELKAEESLLKYLTRTCSKTSPFSYFTQLSLGRLVEEPSQLFELGDTQSHCTLNNHLLSYFKALMQSIPTVAGHMRVKINPTLSIVDNQVLYLTNNNNVEAFQRIDNSPLVGLFVEFFSEEFPQGISLAKAVNTLIEGEYVDASAEELAGFIHSLLEYGMLEWDLPVSGLDPYWDQKLIDWLREHTTPQNQAFCELAIAALEQARAFAKEFGHQASEKRYGKLKSAFTEFKGQCMQLHEMAGLPEDERLSPEELKKKNEAEKDKENEEDKKEDESFKHHKGTYFHFRQEQFIYEDVASKQHLQLNEKDAQALLDPLMRLYPMLQSFDAMAPEQERMSDFYQDHFGDAEQVDLLSFYEAYYREVKVPEHKMVEEYKEQFKKDPKTEKPKFKYEAKKTQARRDEAKAKLVSFLRANLEKDGERINISTHSLQADFEKKALECYSTGTFMQVYQEGKDLKAVLNSMFPGHGKMFSRFLHLLPAELTEELRKKNQVFASYAHYIENTDASYFNANLHPPLLNEELASPGGHNTLPSEQRIPVTDMVLRKVGNALQLFNQKTGKRIFVLDLGFQGSKGRSELYQLLCRFMPGEIVGVSMLLEILEEMEPESKELQVWLDNKLCIKRRSWDIPKENLPEIPNHYSDAEVFETINHWRLANNLPDEVFVKLTKHQEREGLSPEQQKEVGRDGYKPQHINFNHLPVVCNLFKKMLSKVPKNLYVSEMKPSSKEMMANNNSPFVTEIMLQWYDGKA